MHLPIIEVERAPHDSKHTFVLALPPTLSLVGARLAVTAGEPEERDTTPLLPVTAQVDRNEESSCLTVRLLQPEVPDVLTATIWGAQDEEVRALFRVGPKRTHVRPAQLAAPTPEFVQDITFPDTLGDRPPAAPVEVYRSLDQELSQSLAEAQSRSTSLTTSLEAWDSWIEQVERVLQTRRQQVASVRELLGELAKPLPSWPALQAPAALGRPSGPTTVSAEVALSAQVSWRDSEGLNHELQRTMRAASAT